jgi:hypothetical protein
LLSLHEEQTRSDVMVQFWLKNVPEEQSPLHALQLRSLVEVQGVVSNAMPDTHAGEHDLHVRAVVAVHGRAT